MICIESHEQTERRIDAMLQEMVVEEGLAAFEAGGAKNFTLKEISGIYRSATCTLSTELKKRL